MLLTVLAYLGFLLMVVGIITGIQIVQGLGIVLFFSAGLAGVSMEFKRVSMEMKRGWEEVKERDEEKESVDFARDVGRELGREMRRGFEENWKSYVIAGVIVMGCGLILSSLNFRYIGLSTFILYGIVCDSLSKLFKKYGKRKKMERNTEEREKVDIKFIDFF